MPLPCLSCHCNANVTLTCYRGASQTLSLKQCPSKGNTSSVCSSRVTLLKEFCFNCETNRTEFRTACSTCNDTYRAMTYYNGMTWNPNKCTRCQCTNGRMICTYLYQRVRYLPRFVTRCINCNLAKFIRRFPCKPCYNYVTRRRYQSGSVWWINKCFVCLCFGGRTFCRREGRIVKNGLQTSKSYPLCRRCNAYRLIKYMRKYRCKICRDDYHMLVRLHKETYQIAYDVVCRCNDGVIQCSKTVSEKIRRQFTVPAFIGCYNCSTVDIKNLKEAEGNINTSNYQTS